MKHYRYVALFLILYILTPQFSVMSLADWLSQNYLLKGPRTGDRMADTLYPQPKRLSALDYLTITTKKVKADHKSFTSFMGDIVTLVSEHFERKLHSPFFYLFCYFLIVTQLAAFAKKLSSPPSDLKRRVRRAFRFDNFKTEM